MTDDSISVLIVDDEPVARQLIKHFLSEESDFHVVGECGDGEEAIASIKALKPKLVFLDIEMPEMSGIELIAKLPDPIPTIVFVTAYNQYAVRAFEENALDYILKPFDQERFRKSLDRIRNQLNSSTTDQPQSLDGMLAILEKMMDKRDGSRYLKKISCKQRGKIKFVPVEDINWIESEGAFCKLHLDKGMELTNLSIKKLEELLDPETHLRIHKSHMVNIEKIDSIEPYFHGEYMVHMQSGNTLKLSRSYKTKLEIILNQYK